MAVLTKLLLLATIYSLGSACMTGDLRVRDGTVNTEGRIELCSESVWGTVCHDNLDYQGMYGNATSVVVCRQLGFAIQGAKFIRGPDDGGLFPAGTGDIHLDQIMCSGTERALIDCPHDGVGTHNCVHDNDAGIQCNGYNCTDGAVRLADGSTQAEGRVEVCMSQAWGTVSADNWGVEEANVVCRQLGMTEGNPMPASSFGAGVGPIMSATCIGSEDNLLGCIVNNTGHNYDHTNDAGVFCSGGPAPSTTEQVIMPTATTTQKTEPTTQSSTTVAQASTTQSEPTNMEPTDTTEIITSASTTQTEPATNVSSTTGTPTSADPRTDSETTGHNTPTQPTTSSTTAVDTTRGHDHTGNGPTTEGQATTNPSESTSSEPSPTSSTTESENEESFNVHMLWGIIATAVLVGGASTLLGVALVWACGKRKRGMMNVNTRNNRTRSIDYIEHNVPANNLETSLHMCDAYGRRTGTLEHPQVKMVNCEAYGSSEKPNNLDTDSGVMLQSNRAYGDPEQPRYSELEASYDSIHDYDYIMATLRRGNNNIVPM